MTLQISFTWPPLSVGYLATGGAQKLFGGLPRLSRQHQQKLAAAARAQQDARQPQFRQQGARQHLAQQRDPLRAPGK